MLSNAFLRKDAAATAAFGFGWLIVAIAFSTVGARGEGLKGVGGALGNAVGGAVSGVSGAVGDVGGALKGGLGGATSSRSPAASLDDGNGVGSVDSVARSGNWVGAPYILIGRRPEGQDRCSDALIDPLGDRECSSNSPEATGEDLDQASYSVGNEPVVPDIVPLPQPPASQKATGPVSVARLNGEKPIVEQPKLTVAPKSVPPKTSDKAQAKSQPLLSCDKAETIVDGYGFSGIKPSDCDGQVLAFNASRDGKPYLITLNAISGELIQVRKVSTTPAPQVE